MPRSRLLAAALVLGALLPASAAGRRDASVKGFSGSASCTITVTGTGYRHSEAHSWQVGGSPTTRGAFTVVRSHWTVTGGGSKQETSGNASTNFVWTVKAATDGEFQAFVRGSDNSIVIGQANARPGVPNGLTGTQQTTVGGVAQAPKSFEAAAYETQLPPMVAPATSRTVAGTMGPKQIFGSFGPVQPGGSTVEETCSWKFDLDSGAVPPPVRGKTVNVEAVTGTVLVNGAPLTALTQVQVGARIDATHGTVRVTSANGTGTFHDGAFRITESAGKGQPTELELSSQSTVSCGGKQKFAAAPTKVLGTLWGDAKGTFRTKGRHASAAVRGTLWGTVDRCDGTLAVVRRGVVDVRDLKRGTTTTVSAGHQLLVEP
jgi:hypothetical protein